MFGAPARQTRLAATRLEQLERFLNRPLRAITDQLQLTAVETQR